MAIEDGVAQDQLRAFVERIERMEEEKAALVSDIKEIYAEAKGNGFDTKMLRKVVTIRKQDANQRMEQEAILDLYMSALGMIAAPPSYNEERERLNSLSSIVGAGLRKSTQAEKPDPIAALKADPALAIVAASEIKKPIPQPTKAVGSDLTTSQPLNGQVADIPETGMSVSNEADDGLVTSPGDATDHGSVGTGNDARNDNAGGSNVAAGSAPIVAEEGAQNASAATPLYPEPGVVYWESSPPEGVERHEYSAAFGTMGQDIAVIEDDLARSKAEPIVKMGNVILDGWARYMAARGMVGLDGQPVEYSVVQYDGHDPMLDCIRWNLAGRILNEEQKRIICQRMVKLCPQRKGPIQHTFGFGMDAVA
jgi:uncharacterized protein (UPF0335 family)